MSVVPTPTAPAGLPSPGAKKTQFDPKWSIDRICQSVFNFLNRGWLNAVAWKYVPRIPGRETEVT